MHKPDVLEGVMVHTNVHDNLCSGAGTQAWYVDLTLDVHSSLLFLHASQGFNSRKLAQHEHNKIAQYHVLSVIIV